MVCIPSGGGEKYKAAYLDYSLFLPYSESTPHVLCIFVKPRDVPEYRKRYPEHILVELPPASDSLFVGDARFWIMAFVTQLHLSAPKAGVTQRFFGRCFMLDDDVICVHKGNEPVRLNVMLQAISTKLKTMDKPPLLVGFHCRSGMARGVEEWVADGQTPLATALSVSTDVSTQLGVHFHPLAQLGEDVDFDQRMRIATPGERIAALKCNLFSYTRVSSGNDVGADRAPTEFASTVVKVMQEVGFKPTQRVNVTGTYPLLKDNHGWAWQKAKTTAQQPPFKSTRFLFTRPGGLDRREYFSQGVLLHLSDDDLPHSSPEPINWKTTIQTFRRKLIGTGLMVMPLELVPLDLVPLILGRAALNVPWQGNDMTMYAFIKTEGEKEDTRPAGKRKAAFEGEAVIVPEVEAWYLNNGHTSAEAKVAAATAAREAAAATSRAPFKLRRMLAPPEEKEDGEISS